MDSWLDNNSLLDSWLDSPFGFTDGCRFGVRLAAEHVQAQKTRRATGVQVRPTFTVRNGPVTTLHEFVAQLSTVAACLLVLY